MWHEYGGGEAENSGRSENSREDTKKSEKSLDKSERYQVKKRKVFLKKDNNEIVDTFHKNNNNNNNVEVVKNRKKKWIDWVGIVGKLSCLE